MKRYFIATVILIASSVLYAVISDPFRQAMAQGWHLQLSWLSENWQAVTPFSIMLILAGISLEIAIRKY